MVLNRILEILRGSNFECPHCGYESGIPMDDFEIAGRSRSNDFSDYRCPECGGEFEAILCRCGRGYTSLSDFGKVRESETGSDEYVCDCGSRLYYE
jgi:DNA-directed RNA polymerase subunit RPC12/RpoP